MLPGDELLCDLLGRSPLERIPALLADAGAETIASALRRASDNGLKPMVYHRIKNGGGLACLPEETQTELKSDYMKTAHRNTLMLHSASLVLKACNQAGVEVIPLKGIQLAENYYGNPALRPMGDADLLVREKDLQAMRTVVEGMGYTTREYWVEAEQAETHALPPYNKPRAISLDIHWTFENPGNPFGVDVDGLWQRAQRVKIAGVETLALCHEDFLLHLCLHATYHHSMIDSLRSIFDVAWVVNRFGGQINWNDFAARSHEWNADRCVFLALHFAKSLFGAAIPADYLAQIHPAEYTARVEAWGMNQLFPSLRTDTVGASYISVNVSRVLAGKTFTDKVKVFLGHVFPSPNGIATRYPVDPRSPKVLLYYPRRWMDLIKDHGPSLWKLLSGDRRIREKNALREESWRLVRWMRGGA